MARVKYKYLQKTKMKQVNFYIFMGRSVTLVYKIFSMTTANVFQVAEEFPVDKDVV